MPQNHYGVPFINSNAVAAEQAIGPEPIIGLIPAAGMARRLELDTPKELVLVNNKPIIEYSIDHLIATGINHIVIIIRQGKEAIKEHVERTYPELTTEFIYQTGTIGNLVHAIQCAYLTIRAHTVYFCMADVLMSPNPYSIEPCHELSILCQQVSGEQWRHLGTVDLVNHRIIDKPQHYVSNICWGGLIWRSTFTEKLMQAADLTSAMNGSQWSHFINIDHYIDIGINQSQIRSFVLGGVKYYEFIN